MCFYDVIVIRIVLVTGILQADVGVIRETKQIFRLFCHEALRVFHDRLINNEDKQMFHVILSEMASKHFGEVAFLFILNFNITDI